MTDFRIECHYELPSLFQGLLGAENLSISTNDGYMSLHFGDDISSFWGPKLNLTPKFNFYANKKSTSIELTSRGHESFAGDLYGITAKSLETEPTNLHCIVSISGPINKIVGLGEVRNEDVITAGKEEEISCFFPAGIVLPDIIAIRKKTLEVIGFLFDSGKWLYLFADGEGHFRIEFEQDLTPEMLCNRWDYQAMEKKIEVLTVFQSE
jgi:hypothetical protein